MIIGIPKEIKDHERRIALLPKAVAALSKSGHQILVQRGAGEGSGYSDREYAKAGAKLVAGPQLLYAKSDMVVKVKEPLPVEYSFLREGLRLFCYLHLAANPKLVRALVRSGVTALGFETLEDKKGQTPLLKPMSEIAGRLSTVLGAHYLQTNHGGKGVLLSPTANSEPGRVVVVGGGNVGRAAAEVAMGIGAKVQVLDLYPSRLRPWARRFPKLEMLRASPQNITAALRHADVVIGAVYIPGGKAPKVIRASMVKRMETGSVLVDVSVDQGGAAETTRPTTLSNPVYTRFGVIHCAVTNLPTLVARTASQVLSKAIFPYVFKLAKIKFNEALIEDEELHTAVNVSGGRIVHPRVRASLK
jgi:alanine dehydrogenase